MRPCIHHQLKLGPLWFLKHLKIMILMKTRSDFFVKNTYLALLGFWMSSQQQSEFWKLAAFLRLSCWYFYKDTGLATLTALPAIFCRLNRGGPTLGGLGLVDNLLKEIWFSENILMSYLFIYKDRKDYNFLVINFMLCVGHFGRTLLNCLKSEIVQLLIGYKICVGSSDWLFT